MQLYPVAGRSPWAESGQNLGEEPAAGSPTVACSPGPAVLLLPLGATGVESTSGQGGGHCTVLWNLPEVPHGGGQRAAPGQNSRLSRGQEELWFLSVVFIVISFLYDLV